MVFHPAEGWGGLPTRVQKTKIYNLENREYVTYTCHLKKTHFVGAILHLTFGRKLFGRKLFGGNFQKNIWRENVKYHLAGNFQKNIWRDHFGGIILAGKLKYFIHFKNSTYKMLLFQIKVQKLYPRNPLSFFCPICFSIASYV